MTSDKNGRPRFTNRFATDWIDGIEDLTPIFPEDPSGEYRQEVDELKSEAHKLLAENQALRAAASEAEVRTSCLVQWARRELGVIFAAKLRRLQRAAK